MILFSLESKGNHKEIACAARYVGVSFFCLLFSLVYDRFSHGVRSPFMTYLFAWPLALGAVPCIVLWVLPEIQRPARLTSNVYHSGVAAVTVSSVLRGIFEIAGTSSRYQEWLMAAGFVMMLGGCVLLLCQLFSTRAWQEHGR